MLHGVVAALPGGMALEVTADVQAGRGGHAAQAGGQAGRHYPATVGPARTAADGPGRLNGVRVQRAG